jgi:hypothetical protein
MKRREFIVGLGSVATGPLAARAQQGDGELGIAPGVPCRSKNC